MFEDQYVELLPARTMMQTFGNGGLGGDGGAGGQAVASAISGTVVVLENSTVDTLVIVNIGTGAVTADAIGGGGGVGGAGGSGVDVESAALEALADDEMVPVAAGDTAGWSWQDQGHGHGVGQGHGDGSEARGAAWGSSSLTMCH